MATPDLPKGITVPPELLEKLPGLADIRSSMKKAAATTCPVLLQGDRGVELASVAFAIHQRSRRARQPFQTMNCAAIDPGRIDAAVLGEVITPKTMKQGFLDRANGGTLFLDEISNLTSSLQIRLYSLLQHGEVVVAGGTQPQPRDVRIIAASRTDLKALVSSGGFREDLYYRLSVLEIAVPPLRTRADDIPKLARFFVEKHAAPDRQTPTISAEALRALTRTAWPGNLVELESAIERLLFQIDDRDRIELADLAKPLRIAAKAESHVRIVKVGSATLREILEHVEAQVIKEGLERTQFNNSQLARELGISRSSLIQKIQRYRLKR